MGRISEHIVSVPSFEELTGRDDFPDPGISLPVRGISQSTSCFVHSVGVPT